MGCIFSSPYSPFYYLFSHENSQNQPKDEEPKVYSWDKRAKVDPKDYMIENLNDEIIIKLPGSINGMQFIIQNLENCTVYLFDHIAQISIDDCKNCKFFIGPTKGSVFIRDCSDCNFGIICQQFRTRDCKRITTFLTCCTQPIIESSISMKFLCLTVSYMHLLDQLKSAKISLFNNNWNNIHDFTPVPDEKNYSFLNNFKHYFQEYVPLPENDICEQLDLKFSLDSSLIPLTLGVLNRPDSDESCLIVFYLNDSTEVSLNKQELEALKFLNHIKENFADLKIIQTKQYALSDLSAENVFRSKDYNKYLSNGPIIGIELNGDLCTNKCQRALNDLKISSVYISKPSSSLNHQLDSFYNFADMQMSV